jgi:hypothetical protein
LGTPHAENAQPNHQLCRITRKAGCHYDKEGEGNNGWGMNLRFNCFVPAFRNRRYESTGSGFESGSEPDQLQPEDEHTKDNDEYDTKKKAVIFTYSLGAEASHDIPKQMACDGDGVWAPMTENGNIREQMSHFYEYFATQRASGDAQISWVEPYMDGSVLVCLFGTFLDEIAFSRMLS